MSLPRRLKLAGQMMEWRELSVRKQRCTLCRFSLLVKFGSSEHSVRCPRCGANPAALAMAEVLQNRVGDLGSSKAYELSSRGPLFRFLQCHTRELVFSEFFDDLQPGESHDGIMCQDVQNLTFADQSFDVCTSTDVLEHVPDDRVAFAELHRVLKPGGCVVFTVPLDISSTTVERAKLSDRGTEHLLPPEFHNDHLRGAHQVMCFRNYGFDIVDRVREQGFSSAEILTPDSSRWWHHDRHVVIGYR